MCTGKMAMKMVHRWHSGIVVGRQSCGQEVTASAGCWDMVV